MSIIEAIFLGLVQGLTEFLPVSSSGHLVFFQKLLSLQNDMLFFNLLLHISTLLCVIIVFRKTIWEIVKRPFGEKGRLVIIASIPTLVVAVILKLICPNYLNNPPTFMLGLFFILSGFLLIVAQVFGRKFKGSKLNKRHSFIIGVAQGLAVFPGISRSGATISAGLIGRANKSDVAEFSFLISVPIIFGGFILELVSYLKTNVNGNIFAIPTFVGMIFAFISGFFAIKIMIKLIKKANLIYFSLYLFLMGFLTFILF